MTVPAGARLGAYEVVALLGRGGMGEVYRARDPRLGRDVAVKVLPEEFAVDPERLRRFEQEARAIAALNHPNILAVFDIGVGARPAAAREGAAPSGTKDGDISVPYIVTELLEGESLCDRLTGGGLAVRKAVETAFQIAQGLAAVHEKGIVHRDLKPANVFVTKDGLVKILDFGLAKLVAPERVVEPGQASTVVEATEAGTRVGTVAYMSPEQVRGRSVDQRTDIFALGCVLYEMLSGRSPFRKETTADTMSAILTEDPEPLPAAGRKVPPVLQRIVSRCLEKSPENRFQSARDLAHDLNAAMPETSPTRPDSTAGSRGHRRLVGLAAAVVVLAAAGALVLRLKPANPSTRAAGPPRIVVLPFENLGTPEDAYFAAGMTEEITSRLANVQGLGVISRTTAVEYDRRGKTVRQIGNDLGVGYVLEGSVRWEHTQGLESRVRITPQLIRVADDTHVWSDRYERVIADVFAIQSEVAENAVKAMGVTLLPREQAALREVSTNDLQAYDLYLRGQELYARSYGRNDVEGALRMYQAAVARDSRFAQALAGLARMNARMYWEFYDRTPDRVRRARDAAERALELRPDLAESHTALAYYFYYGLLDYPRAFEEFSAARRIQPNNSEAIAGMGYVMRRQGRWAEAADTMSEALEFDAKNASLLYNLGITSSYARRYADAERAFQWAITLNPQWGAPYGDKAWLQVRWHGDVRRAQVLLDEARQVHGLTDETTELGWLAVRIAMAQRDYAGALRQLEEQKPPAFASEERFCPVQLLRAQVQTLTGQRDAARESFGAAGVELEQKTTQTPDDSRFHSSLGIAYAGLGRRADAVREAKLGCDLMPPSKDAFRALRRIEDLALVYAMVGQTGAAIAELGELLQRSGETTPHLLRVDPAWDPLRTDPRFEALLTRYELKP